jgi:carbon monoxide dehydrogenase subunit G
MEVTLDKRFPLPIEAQRAWVVLSDVRAVAACMPGAEIVEQVDPNRYKGTVKVKVGPASASFGGDVQVLEIDPGSRRLRISAKGADRGGSSASMDLTASLEIVDDHRSVLVGSSHVVVNGKFAQFGGRLIGQVSDVVLEQFATNFAAAAAALPSASAAPPSSAQRSPAGVTATRRSELSALAIAWNVVKNWVLALFGRRA